MRVSLKTILISLCLAIGFISPAQAQLPKQLGKSAFTGLTRALSPKTPKGPSLYKWPSSLHRQVQSALYGPASRLDHFSKQLTPAMSDRYSPSNKVAPVTYVNANQLTTAIDRAYTASTNLSLDRLVLVQDTWETSALKQLYEEQQFYSSEIIAGHELRQQLSQIRELTAQSIEQLQEGINRLKSKTLQNYLTTNLQNANLANMYQDLTDYYMLDGNPIQASYNYSLRHPRKPNLWMRRLMRSPFVENTLQQQAGQLLNTGYPTPEDQNHLLTVLQQMNTEFEGSLCTLYATKSVNQRIDFYRQTTQKLSDFIAQNGRRPKKNTANPQEQKLAMDIEFALIITATSQIEPYASELKKLKAVWDVHEPPHWTREQTLDAFEKFIQKTGLDFPRSLVQYSNLSAQETALYDNMSYWMRQDPTLQRVVHVLQRKYFP